jgi:hypothetical protein
MPILYADLSEVFGKVPLNQSSQGKDYTHRNSSIGWNYNAEWNNNTQPQSEQYQNKKVEPEKQRMQRKQEASNELNGYYNNYEHFDNPKNPSEKNNKTNVVSPLIEKYEPMCDDIMKHCSECHECKNKLILKYNLTNQSTMSKSSTNYKDLAILIALGIFIIMTLDKIKNGKVK